MSYSLDANILLYASNSSNPWHEQARSFLEDRISRPDLLCLAWPTVMAYYRDFRKFDFLKAIDPFA